MNSAIVSRDHAPSMSGRLRVFAACSILLPILSYLNPFLVRALNSSLHRSPLDQAGWMIYTAARLPLFALLIWSIISLRKNAGDHGEREPKRVSRPRSFDPLMALRAMASIMVVMGHYFFAVFRYVPSANRLDQVAYHYLKSCPWGGVWIFFTLSGYLMGKGFSSGRYSVTEAGVRNFLENRALRILPLYLGGTILLSIFLYPEILLPHNLWQLVEIVIFDYRGDLPINPIGALWSVSTEVQFYLLVPVLFLALMQVKRWMRGLFPLIFPVILICGMGIRWELVHICNMHPQIAPMGNWYAFCYSPLLTNLDQFLSGMFLSIFLQKSTLPNLRGKLGYLLLPLFFLVYLIPAYLTHSTALFRVGPTVCVILGAFFIFVAEVNGRIAYGEGLKAWSLRLCYSIGALSYSLYVFHPQVMLSIRKVFPGEYLPRSTVFAMIPLVLICIIAVAQFFYRMVELPFERRKHIAGNPLADAP